jgi:hypothetical protein
MNLKKRAQDHKTASMRHFGCAKTHDQGCPAMRQEEPVYCRGVRSSEPVMLRMTENYPGMFSPSRMTFSEPYGRMVYGADAVPTLLIWMFFDGAYVPARK